MYDVSYACDFSLVHPSFYKHIPDGSYLYVNLTLPEKSKREVKKEDTGMKSPEIPYAKVKTEQSASRGPSVAQENGDDILFVKVEPVDGDFSTRKRARDEVHSEPLNSTPSVSVKPVKRNKLKRSRESVPPSATGAETPGKGEAVTGKPLGVGA